MIAYSSDSAAGTFSRGGPALIVRKLRKLRKLRISGVAFHRFSEKEISMSRITQDEFDAAADKLLKEVNYDIEKVLTNHVSVRLGKPRLRTH